MLPDFSTSRTVQVLVVLHPLFSRCIEKRILPPALNTRRKQQIENQGKVHCTSLNSLPGSRFVLSKARKSSVAQPPLSMLAVLVMAGTPLV